MSLPNEWEWTKRNGVPGFVRHRGGRWEFHQRANGVGGFRRRRLLFGQPIARVVPVIVALGLWLLSNGGFR